MEEQSITESVIYSKGTPFKNKPGNEREFSSTWNGFHHVISSPDELFAHILAGYPFWPFHLRAEGLKRANENFGKANLLAIDIDEGLSLESAIREFDRMALGIYTTEHHMLRKGNKPACDRFRVLFRLPEPMFHPGLSSG